MNNVYTPFVKTPGTAFAKDPNNMVGFGLAMINWKAKHRKLKGYMKAAKRK